MKHIYSYLRALLMLLFLTSGVGTMWGETAVWTYVSNNLPSSASSFTIENGAITLSATKGTADPTFEYSDWRIYQNGKVTIDAGVATLTEIVFTYSVDNNGCLNSPTTGTWTESSKTWSGSANSVTLTVDHSSGTKNGQVRITKIEITYTPASTGGDIAVTGVTVAPTTATLIVGETTALTATVSPANATNKSVTWSSNNPSVATVEGGVVTAMSEGEATITVTTENGNKTATCAITVNSAGGGNLETVTILPEDFTTKSYADNNGNHTKKTSNNRDFTFNSYQIYKNSSAMQWQGGSGSLYNWVSLGIIDKIEVTLTDGSITVREGNSVECSSGTPVASTGTGTLTYKFSGTTEYFYIKAGSSTTKTSEVKIYFKEAISTPPVIANTLDDVAYYVGDVANALTVSATGTPAPTYQWYWNTENSTDGVECEGNGANTASYTPSTTAEYVGTTYYYCVVSNGIEPNATSNAVAVTVDYRPTITEVDPIAIEFGTVTPGTTKTETITVTAEHLKGDIAITAPEGVTLSTYTLTAIEGEVLDEFIITWNPTSICTLNGNITLTSTDAVTVNIPITGECKNVCTVKFYDKGTEIENSEIIVFEGEDITFPAGCTGENGWTFVGWSTKTSDITSADIYTNDNKPTASGNVVYHAIYQKTEETGTAGWQLVTSETDLVVGDTYTIGSASTPQSEYVMGGQNDNNIEAVLWTQELAESKILKFVLGGSRNKWTMKVVDGEYLYAPNAKNNTTSNYLKQQSELTENGKWTINPSEGATEIKVTGGTNRYILRYNGSSTSNLFSCYKSGQSDVYLFRYFAGSTTTYSTDCPAGVSLVSISVNIDNTKTEYFEGEMLDLTNVVVTATYSDDTTVDVTERATFSPAAGSVLNTVGTQTITVTYGEMTTSFDVTVNARQYCNITWNVNGTVTTERQEQGAHLAMPVNPTLEDVVFMGWIVDGETFAADGSDFEEKKLDANATVPTLETITYLAVFATPEDSEETSTITLTKDNVHSGYTTDGVDRDMKNITGFKYYGCATAQRSGSSEYTLIQMRKPSGSAPEFTTTSWIYNTLELNIKQIVIQYDDQNENVATLRFGNMQNPMTEPTTPVIDGYRYTYNNVGRHPYFRISNDETGAVQIESIDIVCNVSTTYSDYRTKVMLNPHLSFDAPTYILRDGDNWVMPVATSKNTDVVITYTSENSSVAEIVDNEITFKGYGTTTITATQEENDTYAAATATCTLQYMPGVTTNAYCWATYAPSNDIMLTDIEVSEGTVDVYYVTALEKTQVRATDVVKEIGEDYAMAASTGVLVKTSIPGAIVTFMPSITNDVIDADLLDNMLVGVLESTDMSAIDNAYILTKPENKGIGFYPCKKGTLAANKCYLQLDGSNGAPLSIMLPNGDETAIGGVFGGEGNAPMYNLDGRRVNSNYRGIVIINGKKVVNK